MKIGILVNRKEWSVFIAIMLMTGLCIGQAGQNPFDLKKDSLTEESEISNNPFEMSYRSEGAKSAEYNPFDLRLKTEKTGDRLEKLGPARKVVNKADLEKGNFNFILYSGILILFTFLFTIYRPLVIQIYRAFINDNILKLLHRDQLGLVKVPYIIWYLFFTISLASFAVQGLAIFELKVLDGLWKNFALLLLGIGGVYLMKHLVLILIGFIFPLRKEMGIYSFTIVVFSIILGLVLLPINFLAAFGPEGLQKPMIFIGLALIVLIYGYRSLRALFLTSSKWGQHIFHFFIYLCTVEIAPVIVLFKLVISTQY